MRNVMRVASQTTAFIKQLQLKMEFNNLPVVDFERWLMVFGLTSTRYSLHSKQSKRYIAYHLLYLLNLFIGTLRWTISLLANSDWISFIVGDMTEYIPGKSEYYLGALTGWAWHALIQCFLSFKWRDNQMMYSWIRPLAMCGKSLNPSDVQLSNDDAKKFWLRSRLILWSFHIMNTTAFLSTNLAFNYVAIFRMPEAYFESISYTLFAMHIIHNCLWCTANSAILILGLNVIHPCCYYLCLRYDKINQKANDLLYSKQRWMISVSDRSVQIRRMVKEHHEITILLKHYNKYWQFFLLGDFLVYVGIVCTWLYLAVYENLQELLIKYLVYSLMILSFFSLSYTCLSAAMVSKKASLFYKTGNSLMQLRFDRQTRIKLSNYLKRQLGSSIVLGFTPYGMFTFTYQTYYLHSIA